MRDRILKANITQPSTEVLHQHQFAACLIELSVQNPAAIAISRSLVAFPASRGFCTSHFRAVCAPPLARHACLLEPLTRRRLSGSTDGTRCALGGCLLAAFGVALTSVVCSFLARPSSAATTLRPRMAIPGHARNNFLHLTKLGPRAYRPPLQFYLYCSCCGYCCGRSGRQQWPSCFCSRSSSQGEVSLLWLTWRAV
jgi:hypothetical protein